MPNTKIYPGPPEVAQAAVNFFMESARAAVETKGIFSVALSGGSTPALLYALLAKPPAVSEVPWEQVHIFWGDERAVPPDHSDSNYRAAKESLLDRAPIPESNIHRIHSELDPRLAASHYEDTLRDFFFGEENQLKERKFLFDLVFLGMGGDGHTASLFPRTSALEESDRWVVGNYVEGLGTWRITMTASFINQSQQVVFLVTGSGKKTRLKEVLFGPRDPSTLPAQLINPHSGNLWWLLDESAAALLKF
jgi:6-phosphogluconolactonase